VFLQSGRPQQRFHPVEHKQLSEPFSGIPQAVPPLRQELLNT
jgi:hypothetical protein